jgi:DNA mismatch repair protein MutS
MDTDTKSIYGEYFKYTEEYQTKYGKHSVVLMQVGAFFEVYGIKLAEGDDIVRSQITHFAEICQLNVSAKTQSYENGTIVMAGFRDFTIDKYITKLTENGYTVPVFVQEKDGKVIRRVLDKVYSPGTFISCETDSNNAISNNIMTIWFELYKPFAKSAQAKDTMVYGVSVVNIFTGQSFIFQHETPFYMNVTTFDELERFISIYSPSEIIIISPFDKPTIQSITQYAGIHTSVVHLIDSTELKNEKIMRCTQQRYLKEVLSFFYKEDTFDICKEFQEHILATQSFCYLLNFIQEHNPTLVRRICLPEFNNTSKRVILPNHTLLQLNIIGDMSAENKKMGKLSSIMSLLNKCNSPMGRRLFQHQLTNPTFDESWLSMEYSMIANMTDGEHYDMVDSFRKQLSKLRDIDKIGRQIVVKTIYPTSIYLLYTSLDRVQQMNTCLHEDTGILQYLCESFLENGEHNKCGNVMDKKITEIMTFLAENFILDQCQSVNSMNTFPASIIQPGVSAELDQVMEKYNTAQAYFNTIYNIFNGIVKSTEQSPTDTEYVKIHETEKSGMGLLITSKRSLILKQNLSSISKNDRIVRIDDKFSFNADDVKFVKASGTNLEITFPELTEICKTILHYKFILNKLIAESYIQVLTRLEDVYLDSLEHISTYVAKLDVLTTKSYIAKKYNYCRPVIDSAATKSSICAVNMRHCLIEHLQQDEIYVPNDVVIGRIDSGGDGILLYGTNAVGKTSLIRAIGVSVLMAQTGMYVPCSSFVFKPYTAIFSRILGNDNIFKGLSTFAVEMSELRVILKLADENSLILGDELCSGTEMESALSIFVAGLVELDKKKSSYIFATHFHEIVDYEEIVQLSRLTQMHMEVSYDREHDCLVYDRKLKAGSGPRIYGLEVCKSLHLDAEFLELAYSIRNKYYPETSGVLSNKQSSYNARKIKGLCELCKKELGEDIHHLQHQQDANEDGFIGTFHKNHKANLVSICEPCHQKLHSPESGKVIKKKKTTAGMKLM